VSEKPEDKIQEKPSQTVVNFTERLKLVAHNKKRREKKKLSRGQKAIDTIDYYNEVSRRLHTIDNELQKSSGNMQSLLFIQWYLEELVDQKSKSATEGILREFASLLLCYCLDKQMHIMHKAEMEIEKNEK